MARIGLKRFRFSNLDEEENVITPKTLGKAVDCKCSLELNSGELFADDVLAESDYSFSGGTVTVTIDDDDDTVFAPLLGHKISEDGEVIRNDNDIAPYVAFGRIITKIVSGAYKYKVEFFHKVKFKDTLPEEKTKGKSVDFTTTSIEGSIMKKSNGDWSRTKTFDTLADAIDYLDGLLTKSTNSPSEG